MYAKKPITFLLPFLFILLFSANIAVKTDQQFIYLVQSFLNGTLYYSQLPPKLEDLSFFNNHFYWPLGLGPAILLTPFVYLFKTNFIQGYLQFPIVITSFILIYKIALKLNLSAKKSFWLSIFFIFGSVYTPVAAIPISWYFAQTIATFLILLAIWELFSKKRWAVIGFSLALATLTRLNLVLTTIFFLPDLFKNPKSIKNLLLFLAPIAISLVSTGIYNYQRFGNILESGYSYQIIPEESFARRSHGLISINHIPANLYYMLIKTPDPIIADKSHVLKFPYLKFDHYGMSIFFMSPILLLIFLAKSRDRYVKRSLLTTFALISPIIIYYGIGFSQVGYRYSLDFYPFLIVILASALRKIKISVIKNLTILGIIISWFFTLERLSGF